MFNMRQAADVTEEKDSDVSARIEGAYRHANEIRVFRDIVNRHGPGSTQSEAFRSEREDDHRFQATADHIELMSKFERGEVNESDPRIDEYLKNLQEFRRLMEKRRQEGQGR